MKNKCNQSDAITALIAGLAAVSLIIPFSAAAQPDLNPRLHTNANGKVVIVMDTEPGPPVLVQPTTVRQRPPKDLPPLPQVPVRDAALDVQAKPEARLSGPAKWDQQVAEAREKMVNEQLAAPGRGIANQAVLDAMRKTPRNSFIPSEHLSESYEDKPVEIGYGRQMESPYVVATIAEQLAPKLTDRVLELGTGSGYQTAVLSQLVKEVYTVESFRILARRAEVDLQRMGFTNNISIRNGDIAAGWSEAAPFDAIVVNGTNEVADAVMSQLKPGGRVILPVAEDGNLRVVQKQGGNPVVLATRPVRPTPVAGNKLSVETRGRAVVAKPR